MEDVCVRVGHVEGCVCMSVRLGVEGCVCECACMCMRVSACVTYSNKLVILHPYDVSHHNFMPQLFP